MHILSHSSLSPPPQSKSLPESCLSNHTTHFMMMMKQVGAVALLIGCGAGKRSFKSFNVWASLHLLHHCCPVRLKTVKLATLTSLRFCCQKKKYNLSWFLLLCPMLLLLFSVYPLFLRVHIAHCTHFKYQLSCFMSVPNLVTYIYLVESFVHFHYKEIFGVKR